MGLFNLYKSKTYNYRYIYYDPEKEEREKKQRERNPVNENGEREPILKKGVFREMANKNKNYRQEQIRKSKYASDNYYIQHVGSIMVFI